MLKHWLSVLIWSSLIFAGSSLPAASVSESRVVDFAAHKFVHIFEYSVLFILVYRAVKRSFPFIPNSLFFILSFALTIGFAVTDEIHQSFVPGRDAKLTDVLIDASAALLGWFVVKKYRGCSKRAAVAGKIEHPPKSLLCLISLFLLLLASSFVLAKDNLSLTVPDGYELKEGEIDHTAGTTEIFNTRGMAVNFRPDFDFHLAGFATFVFSNEAVFGELGPSAFRLAIYEGLMEQVDFNRPPLVDYRAPAECPIVYGSARNGYTRELFFAFEPRAVEAGEQYTAILTTTETTIGRYRFWLRSQYQDGFLRTFNPVTQKFSNPSGASVGAPFGLFVREGWQGKPPRFHPVILIHGMGGRPTDWQLPEQDYVSLIQQIYATDSDFEYPINWIHLYHFGYKDWVYNYQGDIREIAEGLETVVANLASQYAASFGETLEGLESRDEDRVVDIVSYSMGGLVARWYLLEHPDNHHIRKLVTIATPHEGIYWLARKEGVGTLPRVGPGLEEAISDVWDAYIAIADKSGQPISLESPAAQQMIPRSEFLNYLNTVAWTPLDVQYYTVYGDIDINLKQQVFFFTLEKKVALGDVFIFSESATGIPAVAPKNFGYNEDWTFPVGMTISSDGVSVNFYLEGLDITKFRFWHLGVLHQPEIKDKTISILSDEI